MEYVTYDGSGKLTGGFSQDLHPSHATSHIEVTQDHRSNWTLYVANASRDGLDVAPVVVPPLLIPEAVTMRQARLALLGAGKLATVNSMIAAMTGPQGEAARIEWEFSSEVKRQQPLVLALGPSLGLTESQLDALFIAAALL